MLPVACSERKNRLHLREGPSLRDLMTSFSERNDLCVRRVLRHQQEYYLFSHAIRLSGLNCDVQTDVLTSLHYSVLYLCCSQLKSRPQCASLPSQRHNYLDLYRTRLRVLRSAQVYDLFATIRCIDFVLHSIESCPLCAKLRNLELSTALLSVCCIQSGVVVRFFDTEYIESAYGL